MVALTNKLGEAMVCADLGFLEAISFHFLSCRIAPLGTQTPC